MKNTSTVNVAVWLRYKVEGAIKTFIEVIPQIITFYFYKIFLFVFGRGKEKEVCIK